MRISRTRLKRRPGLRIVALAILGALVAVPPVASAGGAPPPPDRVFKQGGLKYAKTRVDAGPGQDIAGIQVPCEGKRWRVVGGGADVVDGFAPAVYLLSSHPFDLNPAEGGDKDHKPDDGWDVFVRQDSGPNFTVNAWAICAKRGPLRYRTNTKDLGTGEGRTAKASCRGEHVLGGGFFIAPVLVTEMSVSMPYDGPDKGSSRDDGWEVHGFNNTGVGAIVGAHAICSGQGNLSYPKKVAPAPSTPAIRSRSVRCSGAARVTGGGGSVDQVISSSPTPLTTAIAVKPPTTAGARPRSRTRGLRLGPLRSAAGHRAVREPSASSSRARSFDAVRSCRGQESAIECDQLIGSNQHCAREVNGVEGPKLR